MKDVKPGIITLALAIISLVLMLNYEPAEVIKSSAALVRVITLVWALVMAIGTYSRWSMIGAAIKEVIGDIVNIKSDMKTAGQADGFFSKINAFGRTSPLLCWILTWVIFTQIMCSFYIADWCY